MRARGAASPAEGAFRITTFTATSPSAVNLQALPTRLGTTWRTRSASPTRRTGTSGATGVTSSTCFSMTLARNVSATSPRTVRTPTTRMSTPMSRIQSGIEYQTGPSGRPDENDSGATETVRQDRRARASSEQAALETGAGAGTSCLSDVAPSERPRESP